MLELIYIHGYNSSASSYKAKYLRAYMDELGVGDRLTVPQLPADPDAAIETLERLIDERRLSTPCLIGSSLGGYYATWLAEKYRLRAVLINPAVYPYEVLKDYMGDNVNPYTGENFCVDQGFIEKLKTWEVERIRYPENFMVLLEKGDKVLNYREAAEKFRLARTKIFPGGGHEFVNFECQLDDILVYCGYRF